ncbi:hypothetical protein B0H34DRAFT_49908 [Crassisporium funariophilum]|nr:hypothetical protein B0H34DRAFT_49908 [Crassisporium funariophilum]
MSVLFLCRALVLGSAFGTVANAFSFTNSNPTQCDNITFKWSGGQPPFRVLMIPPGGTIKNLSVPSSAFQGNEGSFSTVLNIAENQRLVLTMSDATGVTAGGVSDVLTVGTSVGGQACDTRDPGVDFYFSLDTDLEECKTYPFTAYEGAVQPITIVGIVPLGQSFTIRPPIGSSFTWKNNLTAGTPVTFAMSDSVGKIGGTSSVRVVKLSTDKSCLTNTSGNPSSTTISGPSNTSNPSNGSDTSSRSNTGVIAGAAVGGVVLVALLAFLAFFCMRKRRKDRYPDRPFSSNGDKEGTYDPAGSAAPEGVLPDPYRVVPFQPSLSNPPPSQKALLMQSYNQSAHQSPGSSPMMSEFLHQQQSNASLGLSYTTNTQQGTRPSSGHSLQSSSVPPSQVGTSLYASGRSADVTGASESAFMSPSSGNASYQSQRVIVHTDIAEGIDEPIELPPSYSEGRAPIPGMLSSNIPAASSSEAPQQRPRKS